MTTTYTNRHNIPQPLIDAIIRDTKSTAGHISVTQLLAPPRIRWLLDRHDVEVDVSERLWAIIGKGLHAVLERYSDDPERQLVATLSMPDGQPDVLVSGSIDSIEFDGQTIRDWKMTSVYVGTDGRKEWEQQLNLYAWLYANATMETTGEAGSPFRRREPRVASDLLVTMIYRDWSSARGARQESYPDSQVQTINVPMWELDEAERFLRERLSLHLAAARASEIPPLCTDEERWHRPGSFAVMKQGRKSAMRVLPSERDARAWAEHQGIGGLSIEHRPGTDVRCESWCAARAVCPHAQSLSSDSSDSSDQNQNQNQNS